MTTTPAGLRAAAEEVLSSHDPACDHIWNAHRQCQWCHRDRRDVYVDQLARHILATAHPDDDEPAHRGFYKRLGFEDEGGFLRKRLADGATFTVYRSGWLGFNDCSLVKNPTCGQVRSLFKILNVEVK